MLWSVSTGLLSCCVNTNTASSRAASPLFITWSMRWPICGQTSPQAMRQLVQDSQPCSSPISVRQASLQKKVSCDPHASHMGSRDESTNPTRVLRLCGHCEGGPTSHLDQLISRRRLAASPSPGNTRRRTTTKTNSETTEKQKKTTSMHACSSLRRRVRVPRCCMSSLHQDTQRIRCCCLCFFVASFSFFFVWFF